MPSNRFDPSCLYDKDVNSARFKKAEILQRDHSTHITSNSHSQGKKQDFSVQFFKDQFSKHTGVRLRSPPRDPKPRQGSSLELPSDPFETILSEQNHYSLYNNSKDHSRYYLSTHRNSGENRRQHSDHDKQRYMREAEREVSDVPSKSKPFPDISTNNTLLDKSKSLITVFDPVSAVHVKPVTPPRSIQAKQFGANQYEVYQELSNAHPEQKYGSEGPFSKEENSYLSGYSQTVNEPAVIEEPVYYETDNMEGQSFTWVGEYLDDEEPGNSNTSAKKSKLPNKMQLAAQQVDHEEKSKAANSEQYMVHSSKTTQPYLTKGIPSKMLRETEFRKSCEKPTDHYLTKNVRVLNKPQDRHLPQTNFSGGHSSSRHSQRDPRSKNQRPLERSDYSYRDEETQQERMGQSHKEFSEYLPENKRRFSSHDKLRRPSSQDKASHPGRDISTINKKTESKQLDRSRRSTSSQSSSYLPDARKDIEMQKLGKKIKSIPSYQSHSSSHDDTLTRKVDHKASVYNRQRQENMYEKSESFRTRHRLSDYSRDQKNYSEYDSTRNSPVGNSSRRKFSEFHSDKNSLGKKPRTDITARYPNRKRGTLDSNYKVNQKSPAEKTSPAKNLSLSQSSTTVPRKRPFQRTKISTPASDDGISSSRKYQKITSAEGKNDNNTSLNSRAKSPVTPQAGLEHIDGFELSEEEEEGSPGNVLQSDDLVHINRLYNIFKRQKDLEKKYVAKTDLNDGYQGERIFDERKEVSDEQETYFHKQAHYSATEMDYRMEPKLSPHNKINYFYEARHYHDNRKFSERFDHFDNQEFSDNQQYLHETYNHRALEQLDKREVQYLPKEEKIREQSTSPLVSKPGTPGTSRHVVSKDAKVDDERNWESKRNIISASSSISKDFNQKEEHFKGMESPLEKENTKEFWGISYIAWFSQNILDTKQFEIYVKNSCPPSVANNLSEFPLRFIFSLANGNKHAIRCIPKNGIEVKQLLHYVDLFKKLENGVDTLCEELGMDPFFYSAGGVDKSKTPEPAHDQQSLRKVVDYDLKSKTKSSPSKKIQAPSAQRKNSPKLSGKDLEFSASTSRQEAKPIQVLLSAPKRESQLATTNNVSSSIQNWTKKIVNNVKQVETEETTTKKPPKEEARNISVQMGLNRSIRYDDRLSSTNEKHKLLITTAAGPANDSYQRGNVRRNQVRPPKEQVHGDMQHIMQEAIQDMSQPKRPLKRDFVKYSEEPKEQHDDEIYLHRSSTSRPLEASNENLHFQKKKFQDHKPTIPSTSSTRERVSPHHERNYAGREPSRLHEKRVTYSDDFGKRLERKSSRNLDTNSKRLSPERRLQRRSSERRYADSHMSRIGSSDRQPPKRELPTHAKLSTHSLDRKEREHRSFNRKLSNEETTVKKTFSKLDNNFNAAESKATTDKKQQVILHKNFSPPSQADKVKQPFTIEKKEAHLVSPSALFGTAPKSTVGYLLRKVMSQHKRPMFSKFQREHLGEYKRHIKRQAVRLLNFKFNLEDYDAGKINKFLHGVSNFKPRGFTGPYLYSKESTLYLLQEIFHNAEKEKIVSESLKRQIKTRGPKWNEISIKNFKALKESVDRDCHKLFGGGSTTFKIDTDPRVTSFITKFEIMFPQFCGDIIEMVEMFVWSNLASEILEGTSKFRSKFRQKAKEHEETVDKLQKWLSTSYDCPPYKTTKSRNTVVLSDIKWGSRISREIVEIVTTWWTEGYFNVRYGEASKRRKSSSSISRPIASRSNSSNSSRKEVATKKDTRPAKDEEDCNLDNMEIVDIEFGDVETFQGAEIKEQAAPETGEAVLSKETKDEASSTAVKPEISPVELP